MEYISEYIWEQGKRDCNEDSFCIRQIQVNQKIYLLSAVCDGIGGLQEGENASSLLVSGLRESLQELILEDSRIDGRKRFRPILVKKIYEVHKLLQEYGVKKGIMPGTTMSLLFIHGKRYLMLHLGDSRVYKGTKNLFCLTGDDCNEKGELTGAVGCGSFRGLHYRKGTIRRGQMILLCSDGFYRRNERRKKQKSLMKGAGIPGKSRIHTDRIRTEQDAKVYLNKMGKRAELLGEKDNITAVLIKRMK